MEKLESALNEILKTGKGNSILLELDAELYFKTIIKAIKKLQKNKDFSANVFQILSFYKTTSK